MQAVFLLISSTQEYRWRQVLEEALAYIGTLEVGVEKEAISLVLQRHYDVIIVDAAAVSKVSLLVSRIRAQQPQAKIVVATASPTWRRAREVFRAGATDYIRKSSNKEELLFDFEAILTKAPLSGSGCNQ